MVYAVAIGALFAFVVLVVIRRSRRPLDAEGASRQVAALIKRRSRGQKGAGDSGSQASLLLYCPSRGIDVVARAEGVTTDAFHVASVGKLFTAVLIGRLIDEGAISLETAAATVLDPGTMDELFTVDGVDYQAKVTVRHLLGHTSGIADAFEDPCRDGKNLFDLMIAEPERVWTPQSLLDFAREQVTPVGTPGERYHYSDTGYIILGLLVEKLRGAAFHEVLHREIFEPLGMTRSWMPYRSSPAEGSEEFRPAYINGADVSSLPSITADWTGGGVASTERDLLRFSLALWNGELISRQLLGEMTKPVGRFNLGMHYGLGLMEYRFGEFLFLLQGLPHMYGHMGILSTQLFCEPEEGIHVIATLGSDKAHSTSVRLVLAALQIARRTKTPVPNKG